jgi:xanthine dehydrogenase YagS FAD-binding subunit
MIKGIQLPAPVPGERALYRRAISRSHAEWPLVEVCARAVISAGAFQFIRIAAGGIAPVPLRLSASEAALQGAPANAANIIRAADQATAGAKPLPMTGYKLDLLRGVVHDLLERLAK